MLHTCQVVGHILPLEYGHLVENYLLQYDVPRRRVLPGSSPLLPYKVPSVWIPGRAPQSISSHVRQNNTDFKRGYFQSESQAVPNNPHAADLPSGGSLPSSRITC